MPTKKLFLLTIALVFLTGVAFGIGLDDWVMGVGLRPKTSREEALSRLAQQERQNPANPAEEFRLKVNSTSTDFFIAVAETAKVAARGGVVTTMGSLVTARATTVADLFGQVVGRTKQLTLRQLLIDQANGYVGYGQALVSPNTNDVLIATNALATNNRQLAEFYGSLDGKNLATNYLPSLTAATQTMRQAIDAGSKNDSAFFFTTRETAVRHFVAANDALMLALAALPSSRF